MIHSLTTNYHTSKCLVNAKPPTRTENRSTRTENKAVRHNKFRHCEPIYYVKSVLKFMCNLPTGFQE